MKVSAEIIGQEIRRIFAALRKPMGWNVIDAFTRLEEREEQSAVDAGQDGANKTQSPAQPPKETS